MILLAAALLISGSARTDAPAPTFTEASGYLFSAATTNTTGPHTNTGVIYSTNSVTGATRGQQWAVSFGTNPAPISVDCFTSGVADFLNGQTVWRTSGVWRARATYQTSNGVSAASSSVACGVVSSDFAFQRFSNYAAGTFAHTLLTNITARTNAGRDGLIYTNRSANAGWQNRTNSLIHGLNGATAISFANNSGDGAWRMTAITPRHAYTSAHVSGTVLSNNAWMGTTVYFVGTDGSTNGATVTGSRRRYQDNGYPSEDYTLVIFGSDLPAVVEPMKTTWATNITAKLPYLSAWLNHPLPLLQTCQHGLVGSTSLSLFDSHQFRVGGDSSNPAFIILSNSLVNYGGVSGTLLSSNFLYDLNALTVEAGLSTNNYQPTIWTLSAFPNL